MQAASAQPYPQQNLPYVPQYGIRPPQRSNMLIWGLVIFLVLIVLFVVIYFAVAGSGDSSGTDFNITPVPTPAPGPSFIRYDNQTAVKNTVSPKQSNDHVYYYGIFGNRDKCEKKCADDEKCEAYTWHDSSRGNYAHQCYGRDFTYKLESDQGHFSGVREMNS